MSGLFKRDSSRVLVIIDADTAGMTAGRGSNIEWIEELHERILTRSRYHQEQILTRNRMSRGSLNFDELYLRGYWELEVNQGIRVYLRE